jgi:hypothetical protein
MTKGLSAIPTVSRRLEKSNVAADASGIRTAGGWPGAHHQRSTLHCRAQQLGHLMLIGQDRYLIITVAANLGGIFSGG